jgi:site-specific DNA-methyltransferase (adenine-specific)
MGSGTTAKMALLNNRHFIGFEISKEYCIIAEKRISQMKCAIRRVEKIG